MSNRHVRRKASATCPKSKLKSSTLDQHFDETLRRVRAKFERSGEIHPGFECVTDADIFHVPAHWPDGSAKGAACAALRDSFRRRGVNRYLFAGECWVGKTPGLRPADDPDRGDSVQVIAVERNGVRSPKGLGQFARFLRDHPDKFPMFSTVPDQVPSRQRVRSCKVTLRRFSCEKREVGHPSSAIFGAFMNMYMCVGSQAIGALNLADRIEDWDPEQQAKLR